MGSCWQRIFTTWHFLKMCDIEEEFYSLSLIFLSSPFWGGNIMNSTQRNVTYPLEFFHCFSSRKFFFRIFLFIPETVPLLISPYFYFFPDFNFHSRRSPVSFQFIGVYQVDIPVLFFCSFGIPPWSTSSIILK